MGTLVVIIAASVLIPVLECIQPAGLMVSTLHFLSGKVLAITLETDPDLVSQTGRPEVERHCTIRPRLHS